MKRLLFTIAAATAPLFSASAQANLSFSGGSGNPLAITLLGPVQYTITSTPDSQLPFFVFTGTGNIFSLSSVLGSMTYSVNGLGSFGFTIAASNFSSPTITVNDMYLYGTFQTLVIGDIVRLNAGTLTTVHNFAAAAPTSRAYATYINDDNSSTRSSPGVGATVVPEPASFALMAAGLLGLVAVRARRRS